MRKKNAQPQFNSPLPLVRVVAGLIINANGLGLVAKRSENMSSPGVWEIPGGKVESGEKRQKALVRELLEELNVEVFVKEKFGTVTAEIGGRHFTMDAYVCTLKSGTIRALEHQALKWIKAEDIPLLEWAPLDIPLLPNLFDVLRNAGQ